jgi:hypothetical protein
MVARITLNCDTPQERKEEKTNGALSLRIVLDDGIGVAAAKFCGLENIHPHPRCKGKFVAELDPAVSYIEAQKLRRKVVGAYRQLRSAKAREEYRAQLASGVVFMPKFITTEERLRKTLRKLDEVADPKTKRQCVEQPLNALGLNFDLLRIMLGEITIEVSLLINSILAQKSEVTS